VSVHGREERAPGAIVRRFDRTSVIAVGLVVAGFVAITIAWVGVSATVVIPTQVAFAVSGGMGGFALVGTGAAILETQRRRHAAAVDRRDLMAFSAELADVAELLAARGRRRPRRRVLRAR